MCLYGTHYGSCTDTSKAALNKPLYCQKCSMDSSQFVKRQNIHQKAGKIHAELSICGCMVLTTGATCFKASTGCLNLIAMIGYTLQL